MNDLDTLRSEVRKALKRTDVTVEMFDTLVTLNRDEYDLIRTELLHLQREEDRLHKVACNQLRRAQKAEAELAAMKARIADAPTTQVTRMAAIGGGGYEWAGCRVPDAWNGKRVRLLLVTATEDGPTGSQPASHTPNPARQG